MSTSWAKICAPVINAKPVVGQRIQIKTLAFLFPFFSNPLSKEGENMRSIEWLVINNSMAHILPHCAFISPDKRTQDVIYRSEVLDMVGWWGSFVFDDAESILPATPPRLKTYLPVWFAWRTRTNSFKKIASLSSPRLEFFFSMIAHTHTPIYNSRTCTRSRSRNVRC